MTDKSMPRLGDEIELPERDDHTRVVVALGDDLVTYALRYENGYSQYKSVTWSTFFGRVKVKPLELWMVTCRREDGSEAIFSSASHKEDAEKTLHHYARRTDLRIVHLREVTE